VKSVLKEVKVSFKGNFTDSDEELHHSNEKDRMVRGKEYGDGSLSIFLRAEEMFSCLKRISIV
jgi:hypothetical protein